jgi:hypothetical protein
MNLDDIRRIAIVALFSDDRLMEKLVLKGGNALSLVYGLSQRRSLDLDFSLENDFDDLQDARERLFRALRERFDSTGYVVFDEKLEPKPKIDAALDEKPWWGGYELKFKLIEKKKYGALKDRWQKMQRDALVVGPDQQRTFTVDLSKHEYTAGKVEREFDYYRIYVYSPEMIVLEKLRAICQQMPEYTHKGRGNARARDFYDIHRVITLCGIDIGSAECRSLLGHIFQAKEVPLQLLERIHHYREFHRLDWPNVQTSVSERLEEFDEYFDFVLGQVERLKSLWVE